MVESFLGDMTHMDRVTAVAERLAERHGKVVIRKEKNGIHLYMASPEALEEDGKRELGKRHLALNVEKALRLGRFADKYDGRPTGMCMKYKTRYQLEDLLTWPTLEERNITTTGKGTVHSAAEDRYLITDDKGNQIPDHPGVVTLIGSLNHKHAAREYLEYRDYDPYLLEAQFRTSFCTQEAPPGKEFNRWYREHAAGWKSTPQGRLIFHCDMCNVQVGWQGRYLEIVEGEDPNISIRVWHPYNERWEYRVLDGEPAWPYEDVEDRWPPIKYQTAPGSLRNSTLCGFDHAVRMAKARSRELSTCLLGEGPLDAGRFPQHGIALLGKYLSEAQALIVSAWFKRVVLAFDTDESGRELTDNAQKLLESKGVDVSRMSTEGLVKDVGELTYSDGQDRLDDAYSRFR